MVAPLPSSIEVLVAAALVTGPGWQGAAIAVAAVDGLPSIYEPSREGQ